MHSKSPQLSENILPNFSVASFTSGGYQTIMPHRHHPHCQSGGMLLRCLDSAIHFSDGISFEVAMASPPYEPAHADTNADANNHLYRCDDREHQQ